MHWDAPGKSLIRSAHKRARGTQESPPLPPSVPGSATGQLPTRPSDDRLLEEEGDPDTRTNKVLASVTAFDLSQAWLSAARGGLSRARGGLSRARERAAGSCLRAPG